MVLCLPPVTFVGFVLLGSASHPDPVAVSLGTAGVSVSAREVTAAVRGPAVRGLESGRTQP